MRERMLLRRLVPMVAVVTTIRPALAADEVTPGYPERVLQWTVQNKESCDDIASALYGSAQHRALLERYNSVKCGTKTPLPDGMTLVVPAKVTNLPSARLRSLHPDVRERSSGGAWQEASPGMALYKNHSVNTMEKARADILFVDRTRVVLAEHTLVIIYGTAKQTAVAKAPPTIELESGEVQAGLAALRGKPVQVAVQGGEVTAESRDTSVRAKQKRATVSVFDGKASIASAGKQVQVPQNFGSSFERAKPPTPPRPLPPGPQWAASSVSGVVLVPRGQGVVSASWEAVPKAALYRVEIAKDAGFTDLIAREEVPSDVRSFRGEKLPPGSYFMRVRVVDTEDFLGLASEVRDFAIVEAQPSAGAITGTVIEMSSCGELQLGAFSGLEISVDGGPFGAVPSKIDFLKLSPRALSLRVAGAKAVTRYEVKYLAPELELSLEQQGPSSAAVVVSPAAAKGSGLAACAQPSLRVRQGNESRRLPLVAAGAAGTWSANVASLEHGPVLLEVVDQRGRILGSTQLTVGGPLRAAGAPPARRRYVGISAPLVQPSPLTNVVWWSATADDAGAVSATAYTDHGKLGEQLAIRASGAVGPIGVDGLVTTRELGGSAADGSAWFTLRWRSARLGKIELGPALQLALPTTAHSPASRVGGGIAIGSIGDKLGWLVDVGGRAPLEASVERQPAPDGQGFVLAGATYDVAPWLRGYALLDAHGLLDPRSDDLIGRGGLSLGVEAGGRLYGGLSLRGSAWDDAGGYFMGQVAVGVRDRP